MSFTIGADPEFFIEKNKKYISSIGLIGGSKEEPLPMVKRGFAMQEDNVAVEYNIPACTTKEKFIEAINYGLHYILRNKLKPSKYNFSKESAVYFDTDQLLHPKAMEFGCEPDFNAWTKNMNPRPEATSPTLRSAGGHIHVGTNQDSIEVIRAMDLFLGVPSTVMDSGQLRKRLYGKAGAFRPKNYGCEYRTLSNFWIFSKELVGWAYDQTQRAIEFVEDGNTIDKTDGLAIQNCINHEDGMAYEYLTKTYGLTCNA